MEFIDVPIVLDLHQGIIEQSGGLQGVRDWNGLESAIAQPNMTFGDMDLYPTLVDKACALGYFLVANHPFLDGNKRIGHAAMMILLRGNGFNISASIDEQEQIILDVAAGQMDREEFTEWVRKHIVPWNR